MKSLLLAPIAILLLALFVPASGHTAEVKKYPLTDFYKPHSFDNIKISPSGEYLAATVPQENKTVLVILRMSDMKMTGNVVLQDKAHVTDFYWVNNTRILFYTALKQGRLESPQGAPGIYGVNVDGSKQGMVHPAYMISTLVQDDDNVLIRSRQSNHKGGGSAQRMDVMTGVKNGFTCLLNRNGYHRFALSSRRRAGRCCTTETAEERGGVSGVGQWVACWLVRRGERCSRRR